MLNVYICIYIYICIYYLYHISGKYSTYIYISVYMYIYIYILCICVYKYWGPRGGAAALLRPVRLLRVWVSEGLTQAYS